MHDSQHFEALLDPSNTGRSVWADSAYAKRQREADLEQNGYRASIVEKAKPGKPLSLAKQCRLLPRMICRWTQSDRNKAVAVVKKILEILLIIKKYRYFHK